MAQLDDDVAALMARLDGPTREAVAELQREVRNHKAVVEAHLAAYPYQWELGPERSATAPGSIPDPRFGAGATARHIHVMGRSAGRVIYPPSGTVVAEYGRYGSVHAVGLDTEAEAVDRILFELRYDELAKWLRSQ